MSSEQIQQLREALRHSPENPPLLRMLAQALSQVEQFAEAESVFRELLRLQPEDRESKLGLAQVYYAQGKDEPAIIICEELLSVTSDDAEVNVLAARCVYRQGDLAAAGRFYLAAKTRDASIEDPALEDLLDTVELQRVGGDGVLNDDFDRDVERPKVNFSHVGGMEQLKDDIRMKIIHPLAHPEMFAAYGKKAGGGLLLYGPPGCGKTHLARATAGEVKANFVSVGIADVLDMYVGSSERNLANIFEGARAHRPCVLFFDEVDALAASRRDMRQSAGRQVINQFLSELDGVDDHNDEVLIVAATNAPWHLDSAFRRPGRFDSIVFVPPPDEVARSAILRVLLAEKPTDKVDVEQVARKTKDFSGADLKGLVDRAVEQKLKGAMSTGKIGALVTKDLLGQVKRVKPSTREWFASARNHALYANQDGTYDAILDYMKINKL